MSKKDEQLIKKGDDVEEEDRYSVAVVDNPIYDVDPDERAGAVAYYKSGQDDDDDEEALVKVYNYAGLMSEPSEYFCPPPSPPPGFLALGVCPPIERNPEWIYMYLRACSITALVDCEGANTQRIIFCHLMHVFKFARCANEPAWVAYRLSSCPRLQLCSNYLTFCS